MLIASKSKMRNIGCVSRERIIFYQPAKSSGFGELLRPLRLLCRVFSDFLITPNSEAIECDDH